MDLGKLPQPFSFSNSEKETDMFRTGLEYFGGLMFEFFRLLLAMCAGIALYVIAQQTNLIRPLYLTAGPTVYLDSQQVPMDIDKLAPGKKSTAN